MIENRKINKPTQNLVHALKRVMSVMWKYPELKGDIEIMRDSTDEIVAINSITSERKREANMSLKRGDLVFVYSKSLISRAIRLVETGKFSQVVPYHVAMVLSTYMGEVKLLEATMGGIKVNPITKYKNSLNLSIL